jgi:hypothetical protein
MCVLLIGHVMTTRAVANAKRTLLTLPVPPCCPTALRIQVLGFRAKISGKDVWFRVKGLEIKGTYDKG